MGKREINGKHLRKDRGGENETAVKALTSAILAGDRFLRTDEASKNRGSFSEAAKGLISVGAIKVEEVDLSSGVFSKLARGEKVTGVPRTTKRSMIQAGVDTARSSAFKDFGVRL